MKKRITFLSFLTLTFQACDFANSKAQGKRPIGAQSGAPESAPGEALIKGSLGDLQKALNKQNIRAEIEPVRESLELYKVVFEEMDYNEVALRLESEGIKTQPNYLVQALGPRRSWPNDPEFIRLWGLQNIGQNAPKGSEGNQGSDMKALAAWAYAAKQGFDIKNLQEDVVVAVVDTGIDYSHPDLAENIWINKAEFAGKAGIDDDGNGYIDDVRGWNFYSEGQKELAPGGRLGSNDPMDDNGHGTHCAGTIGASGGNALGVVGIHPKVKLMPIKFLSALGSGKISDAIRGIGYAIDQGAHILSNSWGGGPYDDALEAVIQEALEKNVLFVAAAGNDGKNNDILPSYPAGYKVSNVLSVGASDNRDLPAFFSNFGSTSVDIFAPGVGILSTVPPKVHQGQAYAVFSGTSMATPHVAGAAAFLLQVEPKYKNDVAGLRLRLISSADYVVPLAPLSKSQGRLNLLNALKDEEKVAINKDWLEKEFAHEGVRTPTHRVDEWIEVSVPEAQELKVHFASLDIDAPYDSLWLYDGQKRFVAEMSSEDRPIRKNVWTPTVKGDRAYVRFVNARVMRIEISIDESDEELSIGINMGDADWNFHSDGFVIDKIAYLPKGGGDL